MKKKDAIERLAQELESRDQRQFEAATEAAGAAATVIQVVKDYKALAKECMDRALIGLAFNRAMSELDRPSVLQENTKHQAAPPTKVHGPPKHQCRLRDGNTYWYTPGLVAFPKGQGIQNYIDQGYTPDHLRSFGFIL